MTKFRVLLSVVALALGAGLWLYRPAVDVLADPNRQAKIVSGPSTAAVATDAVRTVPARSNDCVAANARACPEIFRELESRAARTGAVGNSPASAHDSTVLALAGVLVDMDDMEDYLAWSRLCWVEATYGWPNGCTLAEFEATDAAFVDAITPRADSGGLAAQEALGVRWYMHGEYRLAKYLENRALQAPPNNDEAVRAEMCFVRQQTPGLADATVKALHYFKLAEIQGAPRSAYVGMMMECMT